MASPEMTLIFKVEFGSTLADLERGAIVAALETYRGNKIDTAKALGISERTLRKRIVQYGLTKYMRPAGRPRRAA